MTKSSAGVPFIGIVLPAYNEARVIDSVLDGLPKSIKVHGKHARIQKIVVNDGSSDDTGHIVGQRKDTILINHIVNSGAGAATRTGLHYARDIGCDFTVTVDADGQHAANDVSRLIEMIVKGDADFIIGNRLAGNEGNMPTHKKIGNRGLGTITYLLLGIYVSDSQSGLRAFNKKALGSIEFHSNEYAFCSEMIWKAHRAQLRIAELPIQAIYTEYSTTRATGQKDYTGGINIVAQLIKRRLMDFLHG